MEETTRVLTRRRLEVLWAIDRFTTQNSYAPTVRELMRELDLRSPATVQAHLERLERDGFLLRKEHGSRRWELKRTVDQWPNLHLLAG